MKRGLLGSSLTCRFARRPTSISVQLTTPPPNDQGLRSALTYAVSLGLLLCCSPFADRGGRFLGQNGKGRLLQIPYFPHPHYVQTSFTHQVSVRQPPGLNKQRHRSPPVRAAGSKSDAPRLIAPATNYIAVCVPSFSRSCFFAALVSCVCSVCFVAIWLPLLYVSVTDPDCGPSEARHTPEGWRRHYLFFPQCSASLSRQVQRCLAILRSSTTLQSMSARQLGNACATMGMPLKPSACLPTARLFC